MEMSIADLLKYAEALKARLATATATINRLNLTRTSTKVLSSNDTSRVEEVTEYVLNPKALMAEFDETAKELRLVQQHIERLNHTTYVTFEPRF